MTLIINKKTVKENVLFSVNKTQKPYLVVYTTTFSLSAAAANLLELADVDYVEFIYADNDVIFIKKGIKTTGFRIVLHPDPSRKTFRFTSSKLVQFFRGHFKIDHTKKFIIPLIINNKYSEKLTLTQPF